MGIFQISKKKNVLIKLSFVENSYGRRPYKKMNFAILGITNDSKATVYVLYCLHRVSEVFLPTKR